MKISLASTSVRRSLLGAALIAASFSSIAQDISEPSAERVGPAQGCCQQVNVNVTKTSNPSPYVQDFGPNWASKPVIAYNDTGVNHYFRDTIHWKIPTKTCNLKGTVSWTVVNNAKNSLQTNDTTYVMVNGSGVTTQGGQINNLAPGATQTFSFPLTNAQLMSGRISVGVQDDTAMKSFSVRITGCCINAIQ